MTLVTPGMRYNITSAYEPQQAAGKRRKKEPNTAHTSIDEELMWAGDLSAHVRRYRIGVEKWHRGWMVERKKEEGERVLAMPQTYGLDLINTFFKNKQECLITFNSEGNYKTIKRDCLSLVQNCKVVPGETIAPQYRLLIADLRVKRKQ